MSIENRETGRDALVTLLTAALVGSGKPAQAVYGYKKADFGGQSPVVIVGSAGTMPEQKAVTSRQKNTFYFNIYVFTLFAEEGTEWGEDDAEDRTDLIEKTIRETLADNRSNDTWAYIGYDGRSVVDEILVAGVEYKRETIPVLMEIYDN